MLGDINVILWDFDGTFYKLNDLLWREIREAEYRVIMNHTGWSRERSVQEFLKLYNVVTPSGTEVASRLCHIPIVQATLETEPYYDRAKYLTRDEKLIQMFEDLRGFRHMMLVNGKRERLTEAIKKLGVDPALFEKWFTPEDTGVVKPNRIHYETVLSVTNLPPQKHVVIGDRERVDLVPAHALGMKTCLVWSKTKGEIADFTVPTVYDVVSLFTKLS